MRLSEIGGKKVGLLGAGKENLSLIPILQKAGADITVCDKDADLQIPGIKLIRGEEYLLALNQFDIVFRSPGLPVAYVDQALSGKSHQPVRTSAVDLFLANYPHRVIGVTGTKGKGTTASMVASIIKASGRAVYLAGNIGESIFDVWSQLSNTSNDDRPEVVMELSSFQLEDLGHSPTIAVLTPITEDHLQPLSERSPNFHRDINAYWEAKKGITKHQKHGSEVIYAADFPGSRAVAEASGGELCGISTTNTSDLHLTAEGKLQTFNHQGELSSELNLATAGIRGRHLLLDAALAAQTCRAIGIDDGTIIRGLANWHPLPHRMEKLEDTGTLTVIDDSYATTPDAALAALTSFDRPVIWIGGGSSKGADFTELAQALIDKTKQIILVGQEGPQIERIVRAVGGNIPINYYGTDFSKAVTAAVDHANSEDIILLSPACASKDMFTDANSRGDQFQAIIRQRLEKHGS